MGLLRSTSLRALLLTGRYTVHTPMPSEDGGDPVLITIFYANGDILAFVDPERLDSDPRQAVVHLEKIERLAQELIVPWKWIEWAFSSMVTIGSFVWLYLQDTRFLISFLVSAALGVLVVGIRKVALRLVVRILFRIARWIYHSVVSRQDK
ncbi:hypothetical protein [Gaoshiqia sediminis]|uniref:Uncharacterized protein n=1 Tax=Gaoshiqia sediminis TaxID=2986998 RepID=A0AA41YEQ7_9BACT|nr:hypothetical protein [Gaoshiqia sediminis]MCW0484587.1 hypothetical protein [Gaoshiqia sediminis]